MIKALPFIPYTNFRDYVADSTDLADLPHDCGDGSTCIMRDTGDEYIYHKKEDAWKQEKRPTPSFAWLGEHSRIESIKSPTYGALASVKDETGRRLYWFNGFKWIEMVTKED